jgi:outer membrane receptor protein involved in Fe transport
LIAPALAAEFDLPAGHAETTLKLFAAQSGREIVFSRPEVAGVRTPALRGDFSAALALERMLAGTALVAVEDARTGAFAIRARSGAREAATAVPRSQPELSPPPPMKTPRLLNLLGLVAAVFPLSAAETARRPGEEIVQLSPFTVDTSKDVGYRATNSISATRTNVPIAELPMNIQVVTSQLLDDLAVTSPTQALKYFGSVGNSETGNSRFGAGVDLGAQEALFGGVRLRGLDSSVNLRDGVRAFSQLPAEFVDRVELIRGPAAVLYGLSEPTGIYNAISKAPAFNRSFGEVRAHAGSYSNYGASLDVNRVLNKQLAFRFLATGNHYDSEFVDNEGSMSAFMPQISWRPWKGTLIRFEYLYSKAKRAYPDQRHTFGNTPSSIQTTPNYPVVVPGMDIPIYEDSRYRIDPRYSWAGPDAYRDLRERKYTLNVSQEIGEHLSLNFQGTYYTRPLNQFTSNIALIQGHDTFWTDQNVPRDRQDAFQLRRWQDDYIKKYVKAFVATAVYKRDLDLGALGRSAQSLTFGFQGFYDEGSQRQTSDQRDLRRRDAAGNVLVAPFIPGYVLSAGNAALIRQNYPSVNGGIFDTRSTRPAPGVWFDYLPIDMNQANLPRPSNLVMSLLPLGAGAFASLANANQFENNFTSYWLSWSGKFWAERLILSGGVFSTQIDQKTGSTKSTLRPFYDKSATMPQYGAVFRPFKGEWNRIGFFALYSESLQPNSDVRDQNNNPFDPRFGKGREFGVKFDVLKDRVSGTISTWSIEQSNRVIFDANAPNPNVPSGVGANLARGKNTSEGWEADVVVSWNRNLQTMLSYAWLDLFSGNDPNPLLNGAAEIGSYKRGFGAVTSYRFTSGELRGLMAGLGVNYKSRQAAEAKRAGFNGQRQRQLPSVWDGNLFVGYATKLLGHDWRFQVNVTNLFQLDRPAGWNPKHLNDLGFANRPFLYETERKFSFTTAMKF